MADDSVTAVLSEALKRINEDNRRLKLLEQDYKKLEKRLESLQETLLRSEERWKDRHDGNDEQLKELRMQLGSIQDDVSKMSRMVERSAKQTELLELKKLVELYSPFSK